MDYYTNISVKLWEMNVCDKILSMIRNDKYSKSPQYECLWYLLDAKDFRGWLLKALKTIQYHEMGGCAFSLDLLVKAKKQMAIDRKNGIKPWELV